VSFNPSGGGIGSASDVALSNAADADVLLFNATTGKWSNDKTKYSRRNRYDVRTYGVVGDMTTDDATAMQAAMDAHAPLIVPSGLSVRCGTNLLVDSGLDLLIESGASLVKDTVSGSGTTGSFLQNRDMASKVNDVTICGLGKIRANTLSCTGNIFALYGDRVKLLDFTIDQWAGGRAILLAGDYNRCSRLYISGSPAVVGNGGIRVVGGKYFVGSDCHVESGDDCLQFVPSGNSSDILFDQSITHSAYINCTGKSSAARFMVAAVQGPTDGLYMTGTVSDVQFIGCNGAGAQAAVVVQNMNSSADMQNIVFSGCTVDMANYVTGGGGGDIYIASQQPTTPGVGTVKNVTVRDFRISNPKAGFFKTNNVVQGVLIDNCYGSRSVVNDALPVLDLAGRDIVVRGGEFDGAGSANANVISINHNNANDTQTRVTLNGVRVKGISNAFEGVFLANTTGSRIKDCLFEEQTGQTSAKAFKMASTAISTAVDGNRFDLLSSTTKLTDNGTGTTFTNNAGYGTAGAPATGGSVLGARMTVDTAAVNNSTTLVTSTDLVLSLEANSTYYLQGTIFFDCSTTADAKVGWVVPTGATGSWAADGPSTTSAGVSSTPVQRGSQVITGTLNVGGVGVGSTIAMMPTGVITTTSAGTIAFRYGQLVAEVSDLVIRAGSVITAAKIA
jgi:hypothetical protein